MALLRLYHDAMSQPSRATLLFTRATRIPCLEVAIALRRGDHQVDEYAKINPFRKVPAIDHDGFRLTESVAILKYLSRTFKVKPHWYPTDLKAETRVDEYMAWQHLNLRLRGGTLFQTKFIQPLVNGTQVDGQQVEELEQGLAETLNLIENVWLKENKYVAGKDLTIADLLAVTELEQPGMAGYDVRENHPRITAYLDLVKSRLNPHYDDVHSVVYKTRLRYLDLKKQGRLI